MGLFDIFKKKKSSQNNKIKRIRFLFDYCSNNIFFYNDKDEIIRWGDSLIPPEWQQDNIFMSLNEKLSNQYDGLFTNTDKACQYVGFHSEQQKQEFCQLVETFVEYVCQKADGKYEITNDYDISRL